MSPGNRNASGLPARKNASPNSRQFEATSTASILTKRKEETAMKKTNSLLAIAAVSLALALPCTLAAAPPRSFHQTFSGLSAFADFESVDPSGCIFTSVIVNPTEAEVSHPAVSSSAVLSVNEFDGCTNTYLLSAFGSVNLVDQQFQITELKSATLKTTAEIFDFVSNTQIMVDVNVSWVGIGGDDRSSSRFTFVSRSPRFLSIFRDLGVSRDASATGSVTLAGTDLTPNPTAPGFASLSSDKNHTVDVQLH
jgi:hypothetical protein